MANATIAENLKATSLPPKPSRARPWRRTPSLPALRFTPTAWAKLLHVRDAGDTEVGGFGISAPDDLLLVEDIRLVRQTCTSVSVKFDDAAVADFFDEQVDLGRQPQECGRLWVHTHPGSSPAPSGTDETTFARCFGQSDWAVMFILAQEGQTYCRLRFNAGPGGSLEIPVRVDFTQPFPAADPAAWDREFLGTVTVAAPEPMALVRRGTFWEDEDAEFMQAWREYAGFEEESFFGDHGDPHEHHR